jgi:hypothetical protein
MAVLNVTSRRRPADPDDIVLRATGSDDTDLLTAGIIQASETGRVLRLLAGTYPVTQVAVDIEHELEIRLDDGAIIKGMPGVSGPVIELDGGAYRPRLTFIGGAIDNSEREFIPAAQSGTGLSLKRLTRSTIDRMRFVGGETYNSGVGDSGITAQQVSHFLVTNCAFYGQPDLGIYLSGSGVSDPEDDSHDAFISHSRYEYCKASASAKRNYKRVIYSNNIHVNCYAGFTLFEADVGIETIGPGLDAIIESNIFRNTETRSIDLRAAPNGGILANNLVLDWGYTLDEEVSANTFAVRLLGCDGINVSGNVLAMVDRVATTHTAFDLPNHSIDAETFENKNNHLHGNTIIGAAVGVRATGTGPNILGPNVMVNVATQYSITDGSLIANSDSSGISVGKTAVSSLNIAGVGLVSEGWVNAVRASAAAAAFGRMTDFGPVVQYYKDATLYGGAAVRSDGISLRALLANGDVWLEPAGTGCVGIPIASLVNYADDAAAAAGGVAVGELYRTDSAVKVRAA